MFIRKNRNIAAENVNKEPAIFESKTRISELSDRGRFLCSSIQEKMGHLGISVLILEFVLRFKQLKHIFSFLKN